MRSKPEKEKKGTFSFSLGKDTHAALVKAAEKDQRSPSAYLDKLLRDALGLSKPSPAEAEEE